MDVVWKQYQRGEHLVRFAEGGEGSAHQNLAKTLQFAENSVQSLVIQFKFIQLKFQFLSEWV